MVWDTHHGTVRTKSKFKSEIRGVAVSEWTLYLCWITINISTQWFIETLMNEAALITVWNALCAKMSLRIVSVQTQNSNDLLKLY